MAPVVTLLAGMAFSLFLASSLREGVFFTGDGGVKFALARQFARGELHADLRLPAEPWVLELWNDGLFPLDPPFAYLIDGRRYVKDPPFFPLLTAPFYAAFGWAGLYVVPVLALWAVWVSFLLVSRRLGAGPIAAAVGVTAMIFASPLTLHGAMYWEHTLAVALAFGGIALLLEPAGTTDLRWRALAGGALVGFSAWFRSEHLWLVAVLAALALASRPLALGVRRVPLLLLGLLAPVAALLAANAALYGHPLGVHAFQVTAPLGAGTRVANALTTSGALLRLLAQFFPIALPALAVALFLLSRPRDVEGAPARLLAWASVLYVFLLPVILPRPETGGEGGRQWGPRFLLVVVPTLCTLALLSARRIVTPSARALRGIAIAAFAVAAVAGAWRNAWAGTVELRRDYATRVLPLLEYLQRDGAIAVAASEQFAAQELVALADEKRFFFVKGPRDLERLGVSVLRHGDGRYLFLSDQVVDGAGPFSLAGQPYLLRVRPVARPGWRYVVHEVRATEAGEVPAGHVGQ